MWNWIIGETPYIEIFYFDVTKFYNVVINHRWFSVFKFNMSVNKMVVTQCKFKNCTIKMECWIRRKNDTQRK